jgi:energy-coupling factor transporter ATP-binding protein EcfA2
VAGNSIKGIAIRNLRGIRQCVLGELADVNILIGRNGSGKSTVLDAIYLASSWAEAMDKLRGIPRHDYVVYRRGGRGDWDKDKSSLWLNQDTSKTVEVSLTMETEEDTRLLEFKLLPPKERPTDTWLVSPILLDIKSLDAPELTQELKKEGLYVSRLGMVWNPEKRRKEKTNIRNIINERLGKELEFLGNIVLIDKRVKAGELERLVWNKIFDRRLDKEVLELLRDAYVPEAEGIHFRPSSRGVRLAVTLPNTTVDMDNLGDGARYALLYVSPMLLVEDTAVLIEDPEIHQDPSSLASLVRMMFKVAKRQNLQLFVTTRSVELLNIAEGASKKYGLGMRVYHLERDAEGDVRVHAIESIDAETLQKIGWTRG